jgi:hypothetical protein
LRLVQNELALGEIAVMSELTFYRQKRVDGGIRTGIDLDGASICEDFEPGEAERDPALRWYVDLRCSGDGLPGDADSAREWLLEHDAMIREGFSRYAEELAAGSDQDDYPLQWSGFQALPPKVRMSIACSAIRRVDARELNHVLLDIAEHWSERVGRLCASVQG